MFRRIISVFTSPKCICAPHREFTDQLDRVILEFRSEGNKKTLEEVKAELEALAAERAKNRENCQKQFEQNIYDKKYLLHVALVVVGLLVFLEIVINVLKFGLSK